VVVSGGLEARLGLELALVVVAGPKFGVVVGVGVGVVVVVGVGVVVGVVVVVVVVVIPVVVLERNGDVSGQM
jgi:hypothetical protein